MPPRSLLLLLGQFPLDPSSGAVRSLRTITQLLAGRGWRVRALGTTATDAAAALDGAAIDAVIAGSGAAGLGIDAAGTRRYTLGGVAHTVVGVGACRTMAWHGEHGERFEKALEGELREHRPAVVLTMGAGPRERGWQAQCRAAEARVVLGVRNHGYYDRRAFEHVDAVLTPSEFLRRRLLERTGVDSTALPTPIEPDDVLVPRGEHERVFITYVNPTAEKGVMLAARLAEELATRRPDLPLLVVESRGGGGGLVAAGLAGGGGGFDLRRHGSIMLLPHVSRPRDFLRQTRVLLAPSLWEEPSGRVAAEALVNGIPPIVSDRGGLAETLGAVGGAPPSPPAAGLVIGVPAELTPESGSPPGAGVVEPWIRAIERWCDDEGAYGEACAAALAAGRVYMPGVLGPRYGAFFERLV